MLAQLCPPQHAHARSACCRGHRQMTSPEYTQGEWAQPLPPFAQLQPQMRGDLER
jgi:hypothetical protein